MLNVHGHHLVVKGVRDPMVQYLRPQAFACDADGRQFVVSDAWSKLGNGVNSWVTVSSGGFNYLFFSRSPMANTFQMGGHHQPGKGKASNGFSTNGSSS